MPLSTLHHCYRENISHFNGVFNNKHIQLSYMVRALSYLNELLYEYEESSVEVYFYASALLYRTILVDQKHIKNNNVNQILTMYFLSSIKIASCFVTSEVEPLGFDCLLTCYDFECDNAKERLTQVYWRQLSILDWDVCDLNNIYKVYVKSSLFKLHCPNRRTLFTMYLQLVVMDFRHVYWPQECIINCLNKALFTQLHESIPEPLVNQSPYDCGEWIRKMIELNRLEVSVNLSPADEVIALGSCHYTEKKCLSWVQSDLDVKPLPYRGSFDFIFYPDIDPDLKKLMSEMSDDSMVDDSNDSESDSISREPLMSLIP